MVEPDVDVVEAIGDGVDVEHLAIRDEERDVAGVHVDEEEPVVVEVGAHVGGEDGVGVAVAPSWDAREVEGDAPASVGGEGVDGHVVVSDDALAELPEACEEAVGVGVVVVVDEAVGAVEEPEGHGALLMAPAAGGGEVLVVAVEVGDADVGGFAASGQAVKLWDFEREVERLVAVPGAAVVVAEEVVPVGGGYALPVKTVGDVHGDAVM